MIPATTRFDQVSVPLHQVSPTRLTQGQHATPGRAWRGDKMSLAIQRRHNDNPNFPISSFFALPPSGTSHPMPQRPASSHTTLCNNPSDPLVLPNLCVPNFGHTLTQCGKIPSPSSSKLNELVPNLVKICLIWPILPKFGRNRCRVRTGRGRPDFGRRTPNCAKIWPDLGPNWAKRGSSLVEFGQNLSNLVQHSPNRVQIWSMLAQFWSGLGKVWLSSVQM